MAQQIQHNNPQSGSLTYNKNKSITDQTLATRPHRETEIPSRGRTKRKWESVQVHKPAGERDRSRHVAKPSYLAPPPGSTRTRHRVTTEAESDPVTEFMRAAGDGRHHSRADRPAKPPGALGDFATTPTQQPENSSEGTTKARETEHQGSEPKRLRDYGIDLPWGIPRLRTRVRRIPVIAREPTNHPILHWRRGSDDRPIGRRQPQQPP